VKTYKITEYEMIDYTAFRDGITVDEVLNGLAKIARGWLPDYNFTMTESDFEAYKNQMIMCKAIEIIKKVKGDEE
jgi:hypothetical protein